MQIILDDDSITIVNKVHVQLHFVGEGHTGDYNPDDPKDRPLLRCEIEKWIEDDTYRGWKTVGSFCTNLSKKVDVPNGWDQSHDLQDHWIVTALTFIATIAMSYLEQGKPIKNLCSVLSYMYFENASLKIPFEGITSSDMIGSIQ